MTGRIDADGAPPGEHLEGGGVTVDQIALQSMLRIILSNAVPMLSASAGVVALSEAGYGRLAVQAGDGLDEPTLAGLHPRLDRPLLEGLGQLGKAVPLIEGVDGHTRPWQILAWPLVGASHGWDAVEMGLEASDPMAGGWDLLVGAIYVLRHPSAAPFEHDDLKLLGLFANLAAAAVGQDQMAAATLAEKERLESMQSSFVSIVSHELQTPVAIIKAYAGTLARPDAPWNRETVTRVATTIEEECDRLHRLLTDLLDLSRIQAGRVAMSIGPVDLADLAESVTERTRTRSPRHTIVTDFSTDFPIIRGDREKLRQALGNLVDNAIKYSPEDGPIVIAGRAEPEHVVVTVNDRGIGIPPEEQERVFERFHRADTRLSRTTKGVGLGLYICRMIVEAHGGRIWVESAGPNAGSTFFVRLPR